MGRYSITTNTSIIKNRTTRQSNWLDKQNHIMKHNLYTKEEIILCTYITRFGRREFDEKDIHRLEERSISSIKMKVLNIASMLSEEGYEVNNPVTKLSGKPPREKGRRTNWDIVKRFTQKSKEEFLGICQKIIDI